MSRNYIKAGFILLAMVSTTVFSIGQKDTTTYKKLKITSIEADLLTSYYSQDGDNSAVTGGIGTEELTNTAINATVSITMENKHKNEHTFTMDLGIDSYTSASSDKINPATVTSASYSDTRIYPSLSWMYTNNEKRYTIGASVSGSLEYDYASIGVGLSASTFSKDRNRELGLSLQAYFDNWTVIFPSELRQSASVATDKRNSLSASLTFNQVINKKLQIALMGDFVLQKGLLSTPYHRVYFENSNTAVIEIIARQSF